VTHHFVSISIDAHAGSDVLLACRSARRANALSDHAVVDPKHVAAWSWCHRFFLESLDLVIAEMNDHQFKLARFYGEFVWHTHADTDEVFIVLDGSMTVHFRNGDVSVHTGELFVVPRTVEHKTSAQFECKVLIIEKSGTMNTGDALGDLTSPPGWI